MSVKLLTEQYLEFLSLNWGCTCLFEILCHGSFVLSGQEQTGEDLREMCNKMSGNNHETDAFDLNNTQKTKGSRLISAANSQFEADILPSGENDETDNHQFITLKQEICSNIDENSLNDAKIGDVANSQFEADVLPSGEKEETDEYKYITVKQEIESDNDESNLNDAKMGEFETATGDHNEPQASSSVGSNHERATVDTTYIRDKLDKPTDFPRLTVFRDAHNIAGQSQLSSETANLTHPVPSVAGGTLISMGIFCDWCETIFTNQINYQSHLSNDKCQWVCKFCKKVFLYSTYNFSAHKEKVLQHKKECDHTCKLCGQSFEERNKLWRHWKLRHSNDREFVCDVCSISFKTQTKLISHKVDKHTGESGIYRCPMCPNEYTVLGGLRDHLKYKHQGMQREEKPCSVCGKMCNSSTIKKHEETHKVKDIKCDQCPAVFNSEKQLKLHKRRHEKEYSHYCDICAKGFYSMASVETHRRIHTGERPFSCSLCAYSCNVKGNLDKHMKTHNKDSRQ